MPRHDTPADDLFFGQSLSEQLSTLAVWFAAVTEQRCELTPEGGAAFLKGLEHAATEARAMEIEISNRRAIQSAMISTSPGGEGVIVPFVRRSPRRPADGGDAA